MHTVAQPIIGIFFYREPKHTTELPMVLRSSNNLAWDDAHATRADQPVRLSYELDLGPRGKPGVVVRARTQDGTLIDDTQARGLLSKLHPLDVAIVRELRSGSVFGQLSETQLARLLPLLAQRRTRTPEGRLRLTERHLAPRLQVRPGERGLALALVLEDQQGGVTSLEDGRLAAGPQAYFLEGNRAHPVDAPAPWELSAWARTPTMELTGELTPARRDEIVKRLEQMGIPTDDLGALAVRRGPPERFLVHLWADTEAAPPKTFLRLEADYDGSRVELDNQQPKSPYVETTTHPSAGLIERDLSAEADARRLLREVGFRFEREHGAFVARGEAALRALDPTKPTFPGSWSVHRDAHAPEFHADLQVHTRVQLLPEQGLLDVRVGIDTTDGAGPDASAADTGISPIDLQSLLNWLASGNTYVRLRDGSFVAPSARFRHNLELLDELGAQSERVLVSPLCAGLLRAMGHTSDVELADQHTRAWLEEVAGEGGPQPVTPPPGLEVVLRDYQKRGLDWLAMLHRHRLTGILADDMGLGKTLQTLSLLLWFKAHEGNQPSLVVAPTSVLGVWRDEAERFAPSLSVVVLHGPPKLRRTIDIDTADLVITSYGVLRRDAEHLAAHHFGYVILDEAQSAKNAASDNARAIRRLSSSRRLALTGTPVENRPEELWAAFDFLAPGFLGSLRSFRKRYARPIERGEQRVQQLLRTRIHPFVMRRLKEEVAPELPPKQESVVRCEMGRGQWALYEKVASELRTQVHDKIQEVGVERAQLDILAALTRLRQICCDPALLPGPEDVQRPPSAKLGLFQELVREAVESGRRIVVFSQFVQMQKRLLRVLREDLGLEALWLHGGTRNRDTVVERFQQDDGPPVIVVSLRAGGTGLTLTRADTVMHYDPWWNPAVERQATDRTHRLGQDKQVSVYKLICSNSIEERVVNLSERKEALAQALLGSEGGSETKRITTEEVMELLR